MGRVLHGLTNSNAGGNDAAVGVIAVVYAVIVAGV
jgi:hypothetical protein